MSWTISPRRGSRCSEAGIAKIAVLVTIAIPGQKKIVDHRQVTTVLKKTKKKNVAA